MKKQDPNLLNSRELLNKDYDETDEIAPKILIYVMSLFIFICVLILIFSAI